MTHFPRSPRVRKGAIVAVDLFNPLASVVVFQYNPATLSRTLTAQMSGEGGARSEVQRFKGPPQEDIRVTVEIDATDQLERGERSAVSMGIYPQLSALEMILYPKSAKVIANALLAAAGTLEVVPPEAPLTLFVWGVKRVLPVRVNSFTIEEEAYDVNLNPIRAKVSLGMRVLNYNDLPKTNIGYSLFLAHQVAKEAMATFGSASNLGALGDVIGI
jgi:hypothetical protein